MNMLFDFIYEMDKAYIKGNQYDLSPQIRRDIKEHLRPVFDLMVDFLQKTKGLLIQKAVSNQDAINQDSFIKLVSEIIHTDLGSILNQLHLSTAKISGLEPIEPNSWEGKEMAGIERIVKEIMEEKENPSLGLEKEKGSNEDDGLMLGKRDDTTGIVENEGVSKEAPRSKGIYGKCE